MKSVKDILTVLKMVMRFGVKNEWMRHCEWEIIYPATPVNKELTVLSLADYKKIMDYISAHFSFQGLGIYISLSAGLRIGVQVFGEVVWIHFQRTLNLAKERKEKIRVIQKK